MIELRLISNVLNQSIGYVNIKEFNIYYRPIVNIYPALKRMDICRFAGLCKKWALDSGYIVNYSLSKNEDIFRHTICIKEIKSNKIEEIFVETKDFNVDMEIKFTMMAYQIILDKEITSQSRNNKYCW